MARDVCLGERAREKELGRIIVGLAMQCVGISHCFLSHRVLNTPTINILSNHYLRPKALSFSKLHPVHLPPLIARRSTTLPRASSLACKGSSHLSVILYILRSGHGTSQAYHQGDRASSCRAVGLLTHSLDCPLKPISAVSLASVPSLMKTISATLM